MYVQFIWICLNMMCPFSVPNLSLQRGKTHHFETSSFVDIIFAVKATQLYIHMWNLLVMLTFQNNTYM